MSWISHILKADTVTPTTATQSSSPKNANKNQLYISIDPTRVCFLTVDEKVSPSKIVAWEELPLGPIEDLQVGEPVRDIFGTLMKLFASHKDKFDDIENISVSIPAEGVFFKNVEVPKMEEKDIQKLVLAEIKKTLPVDFSQVLFAQNDLGEKHENMKSFFCVGIQKMLFENYKTLFGKFGFNPYFEIEVFSLARIAKRDNEAKMILQIGRLNTFAIFLEGQIIQDVKLIEVGQNEINKSITKDLGLKFEEVEILKTNYGKLQDANRMGAKVMEQYIKDFDTKLAKVISLHILDYEKKQDTEIKNLIISGSVLSSKLKRIILEEFDAELKVEFVNEENFNEFAAENFLLDELKRYAQCFGLALRSK